MKRNIIYILSILMVLGFSAGQLNAQSKSKNKFKSKLYLYGGKQHNIFKAPKSLFDPTTDSYIAEDDLMVSDIFQDVGFDVSYEIKKKKHLLDLSTNFWYRNYLENSNLNQSKIGTKAKYTYNFRKKIKFGAQYKLAHSNKIGTSITGDDLTRSFIYIQNKPEVFISYERSKRSKYSFKTVFDHKNYYKDTTSMSLNYYNIKLEFKAEYALGKNHVLTMKESFTDRRYSSYLASDELGSTQLSNPLRHFQYFVYDINYKYTIRKGISMAPFVTITRRKDLYQDYYSYLSYKIGLDIKYSYKKLNAQVRFAHKKLNYDEKIAPNYYELKTQLKYAYLTYDVKIDYALTERFKAFARFTSDSRDTNTELEHWKTRRPYNQYEFMIGINYTLRN